MKELEIEFKNLLSGREYGQLEEKYFSGQKPVVQTNFYIDTPDLDMRKNRILLRIRDAEGVQMMTLKEPTEKGVMEYHGEVSGELDFDRDIRPDELPEIIRGELARYDIDTSQLRIYGALSNERSQVTNREGVLVLDRNTFLDEEDFELEYEVDNYDKGETRFLHLLEEAGIERRGEVTKSERFYNKLASIRTGDNYAYTI